MLRCTVKSWTAPGVVLNHVQEQLSNTRDPTVDKTPTQLANEQICFDLALNSERRFRGWTLHKRSDMKVQNGRFFRLIFDDSKLKTRIRQMVFSVECGGPCPDAFILKHCRSCHSRPEHLFSFLAMNAKYVLWVPGVWKKKLLCCSFCKFVENLIVQTNRNRMSL
jgi:hypothetical protein